MGYCCNCIWVYSKTYGLGWRYCCSYFKPERYVEEYGSCNNFSERSTPQNSNYHSDGGSKGSACFLTSACTEYLGKPDNCKELEMLRHFRDTYMKSLPNGEKLIKEYYEVAPKILKKINISSQKKEYYDYIYQKILKCIALIENNDNLQTLNEYIDMVKHLQQEFGLDNSI